MKGSITMKKLMSALLILSVFTVCIVGSSMADSFIVRDGIRFGMSKEEVIKIENEKGTPSHDNYNNNFINELVYIPESLAGFSDSPSIKLHYYFQDDKLYRIEYSWYEREKQQSNSIDFRENSALKNQYEIFLNALSEKYKLLNSSHGNTLEYIDFGDDNAFVHNSYSWSGKNDSYLKLAFEGTAQLLGTDDDNYVDVVIYMDSYIYDSMSYIQYTAHEVTYNSELVIQYTAVSKEQYETVIQHSMDIQNERKNDL